MTDEKFTPSRTLARPEAMVGGWRLAAGLGRITPPAFAPTMMIFVQKSPE